HRPVRQQAGRYCGARTAALRRELSPARVISRTAAATAATPATTTAGGAAARDVPLRHGTERIVQESRRERDQRCTGQRACHRRRSERAVRADPRKRLCQGAAEVPLL